MTINNSSYQPLVTVICLCYNHADFVKEALESLCHQTYKNIQIIVVDDGSTDNSKQIIQTFIEQYPEIQPIFHTDNMGMCRAFNAALGFVKGEYIIDFAADDVLLPNRISNQVDFFQTCGEEVGLIYSDVYYTDEKGIVSGTYYGQNENGSYNKTFPEGDVFAFVLAAGKSICTPGVMVRSVVYKTLGGYDETINYEDYDFFIRASRQFQFRFCPGIDTNYRKHGKNDSESWYNTYSNKHLHSTYLVCLKAIELCRNNIEKKALLHSVRYHMRQSLWMECFELVPLYFACIEKIQGKTGVVDRFYLYLSKHKIRLNKLYRYYSKMKQ